MDEDRDEGATATVFRLYTNNCTENDYIPLTAFPLVSGKAGVDEDRDEGATATVFRLYTNNCTENDYIPLTASPLVSGKAGVDEDRDEGATATVFRLYTNNCTENDYIPLSATRAAVYGIFGERRASTGVFCSWSIEAQEGFQFLYVLIEALDHLCFSPFELYGYENTTSHTGKDASSGRYIMPMFICHHLSYRFFTRAGNFLFFIGTRTRRESHYLNMPKFKMTFVFFNEDFRQRLSVTFKTAEIGFITQWGYDVRLAFLCGINASYELVVPEHHVAMVSFPRFDMWDRRPTDAQSLGLWLYSIDKTGTRSLSLHANGQVVLTASVYQSVSLLFHAKSPEDCVGHGAGFKALFSFHPVSQRPEILDNGLFNCSEPAYSTFRQHLDCNLESECQGGEDEAEHCPFTTAACKGLASSGNKCFFMVNVWDGLSAHDGQKECERYKGDLAQMRTESEWDGVRKMFQYGKRFGNYWFGLRSGDSTFPDYYKYALKWFDDSIAQTVSTISSENVSWHKQYEMCGALYNDKGLQVRLERCTDRDITGCLCQVQVQQTQWSPVVFPVMSFPFSSVARRTSQSLVACFGGHVTHSILFCDPKSQCAMDYEYPKECRLPGVADGSDYVVTAMFVCDDATMTLHYTLVCDFREDCSDASDETFCIRREICTGFRCHNGQCVDDRKRCNWDRDCYDESDETSCEDEVDPGNRTFILPPAVSFPPPVSIDFDENRHLIKARLRDSEPCPDTHFRCSSDYCLPVYLRCNDFKDCPGGEDERECREYRCPGFYRCLSSSVCVHADHLCDGWPQCPQRDDEWLCDDGCPLGCACQGHAFVCSHRISVTSFPRLRYLDASGSAMKLRDVTGHVHLVWLSLARCGLHRVTEMDLPNLRTLDLSQNGISSLQLDVFLTLINLKTLILSRNPLVHLSTGKSELKQSILHTLDLSFSSLTIFSSENISCFPQLAHLNISFSAVDTVLDAGFSATPNLTEVDLRGNQLQKYPRDVLKQLRNLRSILSDDFTLCCRQSLPDAFPADGSCLAPTTNAVSSCEDLLGYTHHRALLLAVMLVAVLGNTTCIVWKVCVRKNATSSPLDMLMTNLGVVDLLMGLYSMVIVVADWTYRGRYFSVKHVWTSSAVCKTASILAVISYEARAFTICIITLQGLLITFCNRIRYSLSKRSTLVACMAIWTLAFGIALLPTLPTLSHWKFHGHSDNCVPLSVNMKTIQGRNYAFGVTVVLHFIVSFATFLGQVFVLLFKNSHDDCGLPIAERSVKVSEVTSCGHVVFLDSLRRFAFSLVGAARLEGIYVPDNVNVAFVIFGFPIISALNPLLYALSVALERRRRAAEQRLLVQLARRLATQKHDR